MDDIDGSEQSRTTVLAILTETGTNFKIAQIITGKNYILKKFNM